MDSTAPTIGSSNTQENTPGADSALNPTDIVTLPAFPTQTPVVSETPEVLQIPTAIAVPSQTPWMSRDVIGISIEGRPIEVYSFGNGPDALMIVAGIHGGYEWNTITLADELMTYLQAHPDAIPLQKTLYILRSLNPDGEAKDQGPDGRANARGVDLNRNFPANWQLDYRRSGCWQERQVTAGLAPASEPETQALITFITAHPDLQALIDYHSAGLGIFPGGIPPDPASIRLAEKLASVSDYAYPPVDTGCIYTGQLVDWVTSQGIAAVDIELSNHRDTDLETNLKILAAFLRWEPLKPTNDRAPRIQP